MASKKRVRSKKGENLPAERLIAAYLKLSYKEGIGALTLSKVAQEAGVPFATAHGYFGGDPLALTLAAIEKVGLEAQTYINDYLDRKRSREKSGKSGGANPLENYFHGTFQWASGNPESAAVWVYYFHLLTFHSHLRSRHEAFITVAHQRIRQLLIEAMGLGIYPVQRVNEETLTALHSLLVGGTMMALTDSRAGAKRRHSDATWKAAEKILGSTDQ